MTHSPGLPVIGVDFDNTIAGYDDLMHALATERGLIDGKVPRNKKQIRDAIRMLPDGEEHWRGLQVTAYGPRMHEARPLPGLKAFLRECRRQDVPVFIVSHKTEFANFGETGVNLRDAATTWLEREGFFGSDGLGFDPGSVFFESTREQKVARIASLGLTHFIDDLEETFLETGFPADVQKLLLCETGPSSPATDMLAFTAWPDVHHHLFSQIDREGLGVLLGSSIRSIARCGTSGNSRVHCVIAEDGSRYAVKSYLQPTIEGRDRLEVEFGALSFLWQQGERAIPRPLAADREARRAAYDFVEGSRIDSTQLESGDIQQVVGFIARLKAMSMKGEALALPDAAEACASLDALETNLTKRRTRLEVLTPDGPSYDALRAYLRLEFAPVQERATAHARRALGRAGHAVSWPEAARTLSPSDLGFHNALRGVDGSIAFLDFEYFGWDDAAKMLSDFLLHPAMRLTEAAKREFTAGLFDVFAADSSLPARVAATYPLFALKWCLIFLNEFVPSDLQRRRFASTERIDREPRLAAQFQKSRAMLTTAMQACEMFPYGAVKA